MTTQQRPLRVFLNDSHANMPESKHLAQGGPSRFSQLMGEHFKTNFPDIELSSLFFSHNDKDDRIYMRETKAQNIYREVVYPNIQLSSSYIRKFTKKEYLAFLAPWLAVVGEALDRAKPDVVYLNGFSLSNWMILEEAYRRKIPICVQHAGIWKKEINVVKHRFSPSIRRIFASFEKDLITKTTMQIFLNEFSCAEFFKIHHVPLTAKLRKKNEIVPLPLLPINPTPMHISNTETRTITTVARWDAIKNHHAVLRLASYIHKKHLPFSVSAVTKWAETPATDIKRRYPTLVHIVPPMSPSALQTYYSTIDVVIIPSRFDVSPTVLMEAVLRGKPVVISDSVGWVSDYRKYGLQDLIISPRASGEKIAGVLTKLFKQKEQYLPKFKQLQKKILVEHSPKKVFGAYHKIFRNIAI